MENNTNATQSTTVSGYFLGGEDASILTTDYIKLDAAPGYFGDGFALDSLMREATSLLGCEIDGFTSMRLMREMLVSVVLGEKEQLTSTIAHHFTIDVPSTLAGIWGSAA